MTHLANSTRSFEPTRSSSMPSIAESVRARSNATIGRAVERVCTCALSLALRALVFPAVALTSRKLQRALLAIIVLNISWQIQKYFFLREDVANLGSMGGLQISLTNIALAGLYAAWLIESVIHRGSGEPEKQHLSAVTISAALFVLFCALSILVASDATLGAFEVSSVLERFLLTLGAFEVSSVLERFLLYIYIVHKVGSREDLLFVTRVFLIGLIIQSFLMLAQAGGLLPTVDWYGIKARTDFAGDPRVSGTIGSPNTAAAYLAMSMVFAFSVLLL